MKPQIGDNIRLRYRPADDSDIVTITGKLVNIENEKHLGIRTSARKVRYVHTNWVLDWEHAGNK